MAVFVKNPVEMSKSLPPPTALALSARRLDMGHPQTIIPDICHFFFTHTFSGLKILHSKVLKFATKIASRQNSVNQNWEVKFTLCENLHTVCEITQYVYKVTHCV